MPHALDRPDTATSLKLKLCSTTLNNSQMSDLLASLSLEVYLQEPSLELITCLSRTGP